MKANMRDTNARAPNALIGMLNAFVEPRTTARHVSAKLFWLLPVVLLTITYLVLGYLMMPYVRQLADAGLNQMLGQQSVLESRVETARRIINLITELAVPLTPVLVILTLAMLAWLVQTAGSVAGLRLKFHDVFSLMSACYLILALESIATYIVIRARNLDIHSQEQLTPPFGLDLIFQNVHGPWFAVLNFFSLFEVWYLAMFARGLAYLAGCSKAKAFAAITPAWILPLLFRVAGSLFGAPAGSS